MPSIEFNSLSYLYQYLESTQLYGDHEHDEMEDLKGLSRMSRQEDQVQWGDPLSKLQHEKSQLRLSRKGP